MDNTFDTVVVGAGVVGLAVGRALAREGRVVLVLERHAVPVQETSSRNSGVIHSGIYYPAGSLKARMCLRGRSLLYEFARNRPIDHQRCGKFIVAQPDQLPALETLRRQASRNGVDDVEALDADEVRKLEPAVQCAAALWCPSTGIVDVHELAHALIGDLEASGGSIAYRTTLESAYISNRRPRLALRSDDKPMQMECELLVNAAGLDAVAMLRKFTGYPSSLLRTAWYAKGSYFSLAGASPFHHLVYPMPDEAGLGIHATLGLDGSTRFGPDVEWVDRPDYAVESHRADRFYESIRTYWPGLAENALRPDYAGVRPKLVGPGARAADFVIETSEAHGCEGLVNLLGIESPGITSCLAIGEYVAQITSALNRPDDRESAVRHD